MKKLNYLFLSLLFITQTTFSQTNINWAKSFGSDFDDQLGAMTESIDGNIIAAGIREIVAGDDEVLILKIDLQGDLVWEKSILFPDSKVSINSMIPATDNSGYFLAGQHKENGGQGDFLVIKIDADGDTLWIKTYGGSADDYLVEILPNGTSAYFLAGNSISSDGDIADHIGGTDYWIAAINDSGEIVNSRSFGGLGAEQLSSITLTSDDKIILAGHSHSFVNQGSNADFWIVKINLSFEEIWSRSYGGTDSEFLPQVLALNNSEVIIAGQSASNDFDIPADNHGGLDFFACRLNNDGDILWSKSYGGDDWEYVYTIADNQDNSFLLGGFTRSDDGDITNGHYGGLNDYWLTQINKDDGTLIWQNNFGGTKGDLLQEIVQINTNIYLGGYSYSNDHDINNDHKGGADYWIVKLGDSSTSTNETVIKQLKTYPNPVIDFLYLTENFDICNYRIINSIGSILHSGKLETNQIDVKTLPPGIYNLEVFSETPNQIGISKFMKQ